MSSPQPIKPKFVYVTYIAATPEKVFAALTDAEATGRFWFGNAATSDWKVGSPVEFHREGKLILKGVQDVEDAQLAADSGADAVIVSNHGGRQLDGAPSSISALPHIVEAVGDRIEVHMDGGIRSGQHVLKAVALGARGTYIGRAMLYGLGAMGQEGVERALEIIRNELDLSMAFCGRTDIRTVDRGILLPGTY